MLIRPLPLTTLLDWITERTRFAMVRYGDGEFACLHDQDGQNCDGVQYSAEMATALHASLRNPELVHGILPVAMHYGAEAWLAQHEPGVEWYDGTALTQPNLDGALWPLHELMWRRRVLYIGPERLQRTVQEALYARAFVPVPLTTAFSERHAIMRAARQEIEHYHPDIVGVSAGPTAKILIDWLATEYPHVSFWDMGSEWDMYAGTPTRSGPKRLTVAQVDDLAWRNFHWRRVTPRPMAWPSVHDLMVIPGLMSEDEALLLYDVAAAAPAGVAVELGTYQGRSAAIIARARGGTVISIDNYSYINAPVIGQPAQKLRKYGLRVDFRQGDSRIVPDDIGDVALLHVDSDHTAAHVTAELDAWLTHIIPGGVVLFHDYGDTYPDVKAVADAFMAGYERIGSARRLAAFRKGGESCRA